ncbi:restriction endonuclease subunit S [Caldanaerobacter subterraneus]|uniref:Type I restriction enzyme S subunit n=1 Tax=Caldanaerobacter subterraneus TaxID=911092 RepID=A0A4R2JT19_9THEO|nr:restriction endonuclease subunit S [Caldanaerobacter subterraneus]TCO60408.1 type I restriction enzyme S subunit [Caldanaerobacter subterraneus]
MSENVKLPDGWKRVRLGEVIERIGDGGTPPRSDKTNFDGDIPWVVIEDIKKRIYDTKEKLTKKGLKHSNAKIWRKGSIILSFGATIGVVGIAEVDLATKQGIAGMELKNDEVFNLFLYFVLTTKKNELLRLANQTTILEVRPNVFVNKLSFLLPPLPEQRKIAEILETIDNAIEKTDAIIEKYKRIKQGLMQDLLTKGVVNEGEGESERWRLRDENIDKFKDSPLGRIPEEWEVVDVYGHVNLINGGTPSTARPEFWNGSIPWLSVEDFNIGKRWVFSSSKYITELGLKQSATKLLKKGMLIISARGTVGVLAQLGADMAFNQSCYGLDAKDKMKLSNDFLYYALKHFITSFLSLAYGNVFNTITRETFKEILIPLPPLPEQQRIASILSQIDEVIEKEQAYKEKLERIKKGLMEDLLTGKVRVNHLIEEEEK